MTSGHPGAYAPYPPPTGTPGPTPTRGGLWWLWLAVSAAAVVLIGSYVAVVVIAADDGFFESEPAQRYTITDDDVADATLEPCEAVAAAAADVRLFGSTDDAAADLQEVRAAIRDLVIAIDDTGNDDDEVELWRDDWQTLADALGLYASKLADDPDATFDEPETDDGDTAFDRMTFGGPLGCEVPDVVEALDTDPPTDDPHYDIWYPEYS